jgi:hypothetical protein
MRTKSSSLTLLVIVVSLTIFSSNLRGEEPYASSGRYDTEKNRWSLADWIQTRDKMRLMDLWLAIHSPSPYEFYGAADYQFGRISASYPYSGWDFTAGAYASLFGVEAQREITSADTRWLALFHFRVFGQHDQSTNITFEAGAKYESDSLDAYWAPVIGGKFTIYLTKFFGIDGIYRNSISTTSGTGTQYYGFLLQGGAFIDFKFVRVYAQYLYESETRNGPAGPSVFRSGLKTGVKLYF